MNRAIAWVSSPTAVARSKALIPRVLGRAPGDVIDITAEAIAAQRQLKVFVSATHVATGKAVVFSGAQLDARAVLASACLPLLFQAVEIDGHAYWDGGYSVNPPLQPLMRECSSADIVLDLDAQRRVTAARYS